MEIKFNGKLEGMMQRIHARLQEILWKGDLVHVKETCWVRTRNKSWLQLRHTVFKKSNQGCFFKSQNSNAIAGQHPHCFLSLLSPPALQQPPFWALTAAVPGGSRPQEEQSNSHLPSVKLFPPILTWKESLARSTLFFSHFWGKICQCVLMESALKWCP